MSVFSFVLVLLFAVAAFAGPASRDPVPRRIWITDVTIVSPENLPHLDSGSVLIENERIVSVERKARTNRTKPPADAPVFSGGGGFLIPRPHRLSRPSCVGSGGCARAKRESQRGTRSDVRGLLQATPAFLSLLRLYHAD